MNILGMGPMEVLLIVVLALIVFGPARLPEIMGQVGKAINDFRRATSELSDEFNRTIQAELQETRAVIDDTRAAVSDAHATVNSAFTGIPAPTRTAEPPQALPAPAPNGVSPVPHTETFTNGTVRTEVVPPLADTSQWSWETAAPKPPAEPSQWSWETAAPGPPTALDPPAQEAAETTSAEMTTRVEMIAPAQPVDPAASAATAPSHERAAHDELLPPY